MVGPARFSTNHYHYVDVRIERQAFHTYLWVCCMSDSLQELEQIEEIVSQNPRATPPEIRKQFWRIVRQIKRSPRPDISEVRQAARIRNLLFKVKRGRTYPEGPILFGHVLFC
jgi:hypothetical protein